MNKILFKAYSIPTGYDMPQLSGAGVNLDHVFVVSSSNNDWNCFGRGLGVIGDPQARLLKQGMGYARWASLIYGQEFEGTITPSPAAGLYEKFDGVCHNAANRILVLVGDDVDVRDAAGNELVTLMYGKLGFNIDAYVNRVKDAAAQVNREEPGALQESDIEVVLGRINYDQSPDEEIEMLTEDLETRLGKHLNTFDDTKKTAFIQIYSELQKKRLEVFAGQAAGGQVVDTRPALASQLKPALERCLLGLFDLLGEEQFIGIFKVRPEIALKFLLP